MSGQQMDGGNDRGADTPPSFDRRYREMLGAGLDLLDQGVTVFDEDLRMVAWNTTFLRLLDFPEFLARPGVNFEDFIACTELFQIGCRLVKRLDSDDLPFFAKLATRRSHA